MITRRDFFKTVGFLWASAWLAQLLPQKALSAPEIGNAGTALGVAEGMDKRALVRKAVELIGGMQQWVKPGARVVIKPNAAWSCTPEEAANVHPDILTAAIELCFEAGASGVTVVENTCDNAISALKVNGIRDAVEKTKAKMKPLTEDNDFVTVEVPHGKKLKTAAIAKEIKQADVFINMPIAKTHGAATLTLSMKNHMGAVQDRWFFHRNDLHQCIADISTVLSPDLIIMDATRLMMTNGPKGPGTVRIANKVVAGVDQVAVDSYGATLFGYAGADIGYIKQAYALGIGEIDLAKVAIHTAVVTG